MVRTVPPPNAHVEEVRYRIANRRGCSPDEVVVTDRGEGVFSLRGPRHEPVLFIRSPAEAEDWLTLNPEVPQ